MYGKIQRIPALLSAFLLVFLSLSSLISCSGGRETTPSGGKTPESAPQTSGTAEAASSVGETPAPDTFFTATEEETAETGDEIFLSGISYPRFKPGKEGEAYFFGRWFEKEIGGEMHTVTTADGALFFFMTDLCTEVTLDFTVISSLEMPYYAFSVDSSDLQRRHITDGKIDLPDGGRHLVTVIADGLTEREDKWKGEIGFALRGIAVPEGGRIRQAVPQNKTIAFFGDSITEGVAALAGAYTADQNSATAAFPWFCAGELGALPYYIGYGGSGVTVKGSFNVFAQAVDSLSSGRKVDEGFTPDLIVVNHGHNDHSASPSAFRAALKRALTRLQKRYPGAPVAYALPFNGCHREDIIAVCEGFDNVTVIDTAGWKLSFTDGMHPSKSGAQIAGRLLAAALKENCGKDFFA